MTLEEYVVAAVMAGGQGSRLNILTKYRGKPAVSILGKYRICDFFSANVYNSGIQAMIVIPQYEPRSLSYHFGDGSNFGFDGKTRYFEMLHPRIEGKNIITTEGTADAIRKNMDKIRRYNPHQVLVLGGDHIYRMNYENAIKEHNKSNADVTIMVNAIPEEKISDLGIVMVDDQARILDFAEKPKDKDTIERFKLNERQKGALGIKNPELNWLGSMGNYVFDIDDLKRFLSASEGNDFGKEIIPEIKENGGKLYAHIFEGYWQDVGKLIDYFNCNMEFCGEKPPIDLKNPRLLTAERPLPSAYVAPKAQVSATILSPGVEIYSNSTLENVVCGYKVEIEEDCNIKNSVFLGADRNMYDANELRMEYKTLIGQGSHLDYVIFDKNVNIGRNVSVDPKNMSIKERDKQLKSIGLKPYKELDNGSFEGDYYIEGKILVLGKRTYNQSQELLLPDNFKA